MTTQTMIPNPNKVLWEKGDFTRIARTMRASGELFVADLDIVGGMDVLDLGCGDGTTAIPAARRGANVLGIDIATNLVEAGNIRAQRQGLGNISFAQGDAQDLDWVEDDCFDLVISVFGAMFATDPYTAAREMFRVTRSGGQIVMGNWIPGDPTLVAQILKISAIYSPPPPAGFVGPMLWGNEDEVLARFSKVGAAAANIATERKTWWFNYDGSPLELLGLFRTYYGPTMNAYAAAEASGRRDELDAELTELFLTANTDASATRIPATYLKVTVHKD